VHIPPTKPLASATFNAEINQSDKSQVFGQLLEVMIYKRGENYSEAR
jgi:hypothetical protein